MSPFETIANKCTVMTDIRMSGGPLCTSCMNISSRQSLQGTEFNEIGRSKLIIEEMIIKVKDFYFPQSKEYLRDRSSESTDDLMKASCTLNRGYLRTGLAMCSVNVTGSVWSSMGSTLRWVL